MGAWTALPGVLPEGPGGAVVAKHAVILDAVGNVVHAPGKLVALLGTEGLVVVDTPDVLLVARLDRAQEIRNLNAELERRGLQRFL